VENQSPKSSLLFFLYVVYACSFFQQTSDQVCICISDIDFPFEARSCITHSRCSSDTNTCSIARRQSMKEKPVIQMMSRKLEDRSLRCRQSRCHNRLHDSRLSRSSRRTSCRHEPCHVYRHALSNQRTSVTSNVVGLCTCCFSPSSLSLICVDNSSSVTDSISGFSQQADDWKQLRQRQHEAAWLCVRRLEQANRLSTRQRPPARSPSSHRRDAAAAAEAVAMGNRHLLSGACELRPGNFIARVLFNKAVNS